MLNYSWRDVVGFFAKICLPLIFVSGLCIWFVDSAAAQFFKPRYGNAVHLWAKETTDIAKAGPYFAVTGGLWLLFYSLRKFRRPTLAMEKAQSWALRGFLAFVVSGVLVQLLKHVIGRKRPYADGALSGHQFEPFTTNYEFHSLPSGHSQVLFTAATILSAIWPRVWWVWLSVAATFSATRVITLNHWVSDVIAGAAVGLFGTVLTFRLLKLRSRKTLSSVLAIAAFSAGLAISQQSRADEGGPFGVGLVLGDPTGLSANYRLSPLRSIDGAVAWSFGSNSGFELHSDYLWHRAAIFRADQVAFDLHYGVGGRLLSLNNRKDDRTRLGLRLPVGLATNFNQRTIEVFGELAFVMNFIPSTSADLDFGVGARIYF